MNEKWTLTADQERPPLVHCSNLLRARTGWSEAENNSLGIWQNSNNVHPLVAYFCNRGEKMGRLWNKLGINSICYWFKKRQCFSVSACAGLSRDTAPGGEFAHSRCRRIKLLFWESAGILNILLHCFGLYCSPLSIRSVQQDFFFFSNVRATHATNGFPSWMFFRLVHSPWKDT